MEDEIKEVIKHLRKKHHARNARLVLGVNMEFEPKVMFTLPAIGIFNITVGISAREIREVYENMGKEVMLKLIDDRIRDVRNHYGTI